MVIIRNKSFPITFSLIHKSRSLMIQSFSTCWAFLGGGEAKISTCEIGQTFRPLVPRPRCVCVCVFFPFILDIKLLDVPAGVTQEEGHRIFHPPSFCGACLSFSRGKDSAIPYPRRPCVCVCFLPIRSGHQVRWTYQPGSQEEGHTGFLIHLLSAVRALIFLARRIQPFLSLVDREVEFCVPTI